MAEAEKPTHYEVLHDQWGFDTSDKRAPRKGDVLTADVVEPHLPWAVDQGVVAPLSARDAKARLEDREDVVDEDVTSAGADASQEVRTRAAVQQTRAAEERQNQANRRLVEEQDASNAPGTESNPIPVDVSRSPTPRISK